MLKEWKGTGPVEFDHVGIVVPDIEEGRQLLSEMFGIEKWTEVIEDHGIGVYVQFGIGRDGPCYELVSPLHAISPVSSALRTGKGTLNHVAYLVADLSSAAERLRELECLPVTEAQPAVAYDGNIVQFFLSPLRFIVELIEAPDHQHRFVKEH
jgi:methylmalonyl-CoA/ethylmalonyl-CoA epimerase